jgi:tRNA A-37 threonylcarbamoyl transferase component Bud32/tetratricopeptide (TPR) repeat protein
MPFANGENVGAYRIVEKLGQGGMATVYKAYHPALDRYVAIKVMHPAFMEDPNFLARFQREARIVAKLDHAHIIPIYDFAEHNGHPYLVMRFIEGKTLKARIDRGPQKLQEVLRIARAVGQALTYAHGQGVLHRDIKPSNILLTPEGGVYLTDFGLARMAEAGESTLSRDMMVGTPQYISPEQAKGIRKLDARTDVYSLGVVLYELLVGRAPFTADTPYAIIHDHIFTPLPLPRELNPDLPESLERVLLKALAKEPGDRFQSVEELIVALEAAMELELKARETIVVPPPSTVARRIEAVEQPTEVKPEPKSEPEKKKRRWLWAVAAIGIPLCVIVLIAGFLFARQRLLRVRQEREAVSAESLLEEARAAQEQGDPEHALELYKAAVEADPHLVPAYMESSMLLAEMGREDESLDILTQGVEANPDNADLHTLAAGTALLLLQLDKAQREIEWMQRGMPDAPITYAYDGILILERDRPCEEARPALDKAKRAEPDLPWFHYGMAICFIREGNPGAATDELHLVLDQENIPPLLRKRAEEMVSKLEKEPAPADEAILQEFDDLARLAGEIKDDDLRTHFKEILNQARTAWREKDKERSLRLVEELLSWTQENQDAIGLALARTLIFKLNRILRLAQ